MKPETKQEKRFAEVIVPRSKWDAVAVKLVLFGMRGFPDRTILGNGKCFFIEFKSPGEPLKPNQRRWKRILERVGFKVYVCYSAEEAKEVYEREMEST